MNELTTFNNEEFNANVRVVIQNGEPYFVAVDICKALDLSDTGRAVERLDSDESTRIEIDHPQSPQKKIEVIAVNESGLYNLIFGSRKPEAKAFKRWITHEVLPSIRKTGKYEVSPKSDTELVVEGLQAASRIIDQLRGEITALTPKAEAYNILLDSLPSIFFLESEK